MELLREVLYAIIIVVVPVLTKYIIRFIQDKTTEVNAKIDGTKYEVMKKYVDDSSAMIVDVVKMVNQTYVDKMKADGTFTKEAQIEAFNMAFKTAKSMLTEDARNAICAICMDVDTYLRTGIETAVLDNKAS